MKIIKKNIKKIIPGIIILSIVLIRVFIIKPVRVNGYSMNPTLKHNELLLLNKMDHSYNRFDIIVFNYNNQKLIKRIVGMPGEKIEYKDNHLFVDGEFAYENFEHEKTDDFKYQFEIPKGYYFVLGDNRTNSLDSRYIGLVNEKQIDGVVNISIFPPKKVSRSILAEN